MFIKINLYFEVQGPIQPEEVRELQVALGEVLTKAMLTRASWREWTANSTDGRVMQVSLRPASVVRKAMIKIPPQAATEPNDSPRKVSLLSLLKEKGH